jgi:hypothetical protein
LLGVQDQETGEAGGGGDRLTIPRFMLPTILIQEEEVIAIWCHPNWAFEQVRQFAITAGLQGSEHEPCTHHVPAGVSLH